MHVATCTSGAHPHLVDTTRTSTSGIAATGMLLQSRESAALSCVHSTAQLIPAARLPGDVQSKRSPHRDEVLDDLNCEIAVLAVMQSQENLNKL